MADAHQQCRSSAFAAPVSRRRFLSMSAAAGMGVVGASALSACAPSAGSGLADSPNTIRAAIAGEPDQLDPHKTSSYFSFEILENVFDTLVEPNEQLQMVPALAQRWEVSPDATRWTFTLRPGVQFHNGDPLTANDVVYSYRRIIDQQLSSSWRLENVATVKAPDAQTVVLTTTSPSPNLLANIGGFKGMAIVNPRNVESGEITTRPVGTGPFAYESGSPGTSLVLKARPGHWSGGPHVTVSPSVSSPRAPPRSRPYAPARWTGPIPFRRNRSASCVTTTRSPSARWSPTTTGM